MTWEMSLMTININIVIEHALSFQLTLTIIILYIFGRSIHIAYRMRGFVLRSFINKSKLPYQ